MKSIVKTWLSLGVTVAMLLPLTTILWSAQQQDLVERDEYVPGELLIKFADRASLLTVENTAKSVGAKHIKTFQAIGVRHWRLGKGVSVEQALAILSKPPYRDAIEYAEPNYIVHAFEFPDDPLRNDLWGLHNNHNSGGMEDHDIDALEAWANGHTGDASIVVGCIDGGIDYDHEDLKDNIWTNPAELNGMPGVDDDGNGYIDDVRGWDFAKDDNDPMDYDGHGSHIAGTIGAVGDNGIGITGINWTVKLMPLRFIDCGKGTIADEIEAILYAKGKGVRITNNSYGGTKASNSEKDAIASCGALFVAAAGNGGSNRKFYPAGHDLANIISVAATDQNDNLASFSNYGSDWVDLGAPGVHILSTVTYSNFDDYEYRDGTSMAAPHVAGAAALLLAAEPGLKNDDLKNRILNSVDHCQGLEGKVLKEGRLNVMAALGDPEFGDDYITPAAIVDLIASEPTPRSVTLTWTATGDDDITGQAYLYDVRYWLDGGNWDNATQVQGEPNPQPQGATETFTVEGLSPNTTYYFALKVKDDVGNLSGLSNVVGATTAGGQWTSEIIDEGGTFGRGTMVYDMSTTPVPAIGYPKDQNVKFAHRNGTPPYPWSTEIADPGVGTDGGVDLAYDPVDKNPSLAYVGGGLNFVHWNGSSWVKTVVGGATGYRPSLKYNATGKPSISYSTSNRKARSLRFAEFNGTWTTQLVENVNLRWKISTCLAYDSYGNPSIAYSDALHPNDNLNETLKFAKRSDGSWSTEIVETNVKAYCECISLAYGPEDCPSIAYGVDEVRFLSRGPSGWNLEIVDAGESVEGISLAYSNGMPFISYEISDAWGLVCVKVAHKDPSAGWVYEVVEEVLGSTSTSLILDSEGNPSVSYYTGNTLKFTQKTEGGGGGGMSSTPFSAVGSLLSLLQNRPNPFSRTTLISYILPDAESRHTTLDIYDLSGRLVETLVDERQEPGVYHVKWEGKEVPSGVYLYRLTAGDLTATRKLVILK